MVHKAFNKKSSGGAVKRPQSETLYEINLLLKIELHQANF